MSVERWETKTLGEIAEVVMGQSPAGDTCNDIGEGTPLLNGPTEFGSSHPNPIQFTINPRKFAEARDLLFCVRGSTTGKMNWADQKYAIGRGLAALRHRSSLSLQPFLKGIIDSYLPSLLAEATGSTFPNISSQQLNNLMIKVPDILTQTRIADILTALDDRIELNRQTNATLEAIAQAIFKEWFVNFRFPGSTGEMQDSELGLIPKGWRVEKIKNITTKIQYGLTQKASTKEVGPHFLRITDIQKGIIEWSCVPFCMANEKEYEKYKIEKYDIFIARTGASTGENALVVNQPKSVFASYLIRIQFDMPELSVYVAKFLRTNKYFDFIDGIKGGSAQLNPMPMHNN